MGRAFAQAVAGDARGAFNLAAEPQLSGTDLASAFGGRAVSVSPRILRALAAASWRARLQPTAPALRPRPSTRKLEAAFARAS